MCACFACSEWFEVQSRCDLCRCGGRVTYFVLRVVCDFGSPASVNEMRLLQ